MELILSGGWIGKEGLFEALVSEPLILSNLEEIPKEKDLFLVVSYDLTGETLETPVKRRGLPEVIAVPLLGVRPYRRKPGNYHITFEGMSLDREMFLKGVQRVKDYIERGDVYQINLTSEIRFSLEGDPEGLFLDFFGRQPVPYGFFLRTGDLVILSGSMELFLERRGSKIVSKPIKGTGRTPEEILSKEKERAENLMITDMMRNDIGRIARRGSVRVSDLFKVEEFSTLCQMHSTVEGETDKDLVEILKNTFPPASVTGAPKRRAVQIIDEIEPHPRGYYCGTAGMVFRNGDFTLSVLIRTAYGTGSSISYFAGCGIVWDSDPEGEFEELLLKVRAFYPKIHSYAGPERICDRSP